MYSASSRANWRPSERKSPRSCPTRSTMTPALAECRILSGATLVWCWADRTAGSCVTVIAELLGDSQRQLRAHAADVGQQQGVVDGGRDEHGGPRAAAAGGGHPVAAQD